jgi:hypothetical protein
MWSKQSIRRFEKSLDKAEKDYEKKLEQGLVRGALFLLAKSQEVVPVDTGALKASGTIRQEGKGAKTIVFVVYTDSKAVIVHERIKGPRGKKVYHAEPTQAKFLERPMIRYRKEIARIIRDSMNGTFKGGATP